jgi:hypothetical protein
MNTGTLETLKQLFRSPVWDGNLVSKDHRDALVKRGLVIKCAEGINLITPKGVTILADLGMIQY